MCIYVHEHQGNRRFKHKQGIRRTSRRRQGRVIHWGLLLSRGALLAGGDLEQISSCLQRKSGVINLTRWNSAFVNNSLMFHLGDNILSDLQFYYSPPQDKTHNLKDNRFKGPRGTNSTPTGDKPVLPTSSFIFKEEDRSNNPQRCCFLLLHLYFAGAGFFSTVKNVI